MKTLTDKQVDEERVRLRNMLFEQIANEIDRLQVSRTELSRRMGVNRSYVSNALNGNAPLGINGLIRFALALELGLQITTGEATPAPKPKPRKRGGRRDRICKKLLAVWEDYDPEFGLGKLVSFLKPVGEPMNAMTDAKLEALLDEILARKKE